ncbi:MAG TPA: 2-succinyl-5-enolpyruvyl-6-hydroxy-3-cyclohexene-1-carboxylic-acid synthase, partial [Chloroflexota bacterium]
MTSEASTQHAIAAFVGALVDELVRSGVRHFCACPGSRSTPLTLTVARHPAARLWMHLDERSAAFFGLGLAKALQEPVALVCTSGTAAANFLPAVVEACYARVPLVVLTADRPHELRDCGAPQTIDQIRLFGTHVKWFVDLPEPDSSPELVRYARWVACRAVATARRGPSGPVHLNCPYREPLIPAERPVAADEAADRPSATVAHGPRDPDVGLVAELAAALRSTPRGLIVCGPLPRQGLAPSVARLAEALGYPVLADPLSGVRCGPHSRRLVLDCYDAALRDGSVVERLKPEVVLRFGGPPTSKPLTLYLERHRPRQIVVDGDGGWDEPSHLATDVVHVDERRLCEALASAVADGGAGMAPDAAWMESWRAVDRLARETIAARLAALDELFEGKVFAELAALLPDGALLYAGNSMP